MSAESSKMPKAKLMAILSLVLGIHGLVLSFIPFVIAGIFAFLLVIPSIILGIMALLKAIKNHTAGKGLAIAGLACCGVALSFGIVFQAVATPAIMKHRRKVLAATCRANMRQLQSAAEAWSMSKGHGQTPSMKDLCGGPDKYLLTEPKCPKTGSSYRIRRNRNGGFDVECGSGDSKHVLSSYYW